MESPEKNPPIDDDEEELHLTPSLEAMLHPAPKKVHREFQIRPDVEKRFKGFAAKEVIRNILQQELTGAQYEVEKVEELTKYLANIIRKRMEGIVYKRYKLVVHVILGENKGAGVKCGARCLWDPECDNYASDYFINESLFCVATVYGILFY